MIEDTFFKIFFTQMILKFLVFCYHSLILLKIIIITIVVVIAAAVH